MSNFKDDRGFIKKEVDEHGVAEILFSHPSHNSFPAVQLKILAATITEAGKDKNVRIILLKSGGERTFCAGASFDELLTINTEAAVKTFFSAFAYVINAIRLTKKLVVCQVQGKAIGGGVGLAAACDYCFATEHASIRLSELGLNIGPFVIGPAVERKIGLSAFTELTLHPDDDKDAQWAKRQGLYHEVYPDLSSMNEAVQQFCQRMSTYNPAVLTALKEMFWHNTQHWDSVLYERAVISGKLALKKEAKASLAAFKNRK